ncbi:acyl-CoA thioesterase [Blastochloris viridis]|uniref:Acyl-CoA hydrolase n=1 Tax=Blastochloris viridis TaxID=1079 RepID=A0A0H5BGE7_BLAVI|nr:acyl-CoA thioesterase [Blastochloris viridis]ALK09880.1 putative acyl-CoA thioester hydrolase [Blastochloris viridis]BAS00215.1 acyl-CoA hydrolase [Blastochloris viridis]CUU42543.1 putative acyl-CoA thioester hydrolase [Blastochloris viridis]
MRGQVVRATRLVDIVFPGDTNHHGTLFGGIGLAHMDKVAFITATRHAPVDFVTASCDGIDFKAPGRLGDIIELTGRVVKVGRRSLAAEVEMVAEAPLTGERRRCGGGVFNMVAVGELAGLGGQLPQLKPAPMVEPDAELRSVELVFPEHTSHYGSLYGGNALAAMGKAAFVVATRYCRRSVVLAAAKRVDFTAHVHEGEIVELVSRVSAVGNTSMTVTVEMWAETLGTGARRLCGHGQFVMVAVDDRHHPIPARPVVAVDTAG